MLLYFLFDSVFPGCPKKMATEKWPKATNSPLENTVANKAGRIENGLCNRFIVRIYIRRKRILAWRWK